jgi:hypothetical protein
VRKDFARASDTVSENRLLGGVIFRSSQGKSGSAAHDLALLGRKHVFEARRVDDAVALIGRHGTQVAHGRADHALPVGRQLLHPAEHIARFGFLAGSEVLPGLHAVQHALLLLRRKTGKVIEPLPQLLLPLGRQAAEAGIVLQHAFPVGGRKALIAAEPVPGMVLLACLYGMELATLGKAGRKSGDDGRNAQHDRQLPFPYKISQTHSLRPLLRPRTY